MALNFGTKVEQIKTNVVAAGCTDESLMESIEAVAQASEALYEAQADGAVICQVLDNLSLATQAMAKGGLSKQVLGAFNSEGELSAVCGQENLTVEALEKLGEADVKALEAKYSAGLEGQMAEYWNKLVAWLKNLWTKLVNWFKSLLTNQARYKKQLEAITGTLKDDGFNGEATLSIHTYAEIEGALDSCKKLIINLEKAGNEFKTAGDLKSEAAVEKSKKWYSFFGVFENDVKGLKTYADAEAKEQTLKAAGFANAGKVKDLAAKYCDVAASASFANATKAFTDGLSNLVKEAGAAGSLEGEAAAKAKEAVNERRAGVSKMLENIRRVAGAVQKCGGEILKAAKASQTKAAAKK